MDSEQKAELYLQHPAESPPVVGVLPYLILPNFLKQVEAILAWRAAISPTGRFWKAD